ncbi:MAG: PAS domain S-box protein [Kiritimatiellae bacterium]|nr:PAS domain S-box protein [Kiritimatiellia bacterium]
MKTRNRIWLTILPILLISFAVMGILVVTTLSTLHRGHLDVAHELAKIQAESAVFLESSDAAKSTETSHDRALKEHLKQTLASLEIHAEASRKDTLDLLIFLTTAATALLLAALLAGYLMATHIARPTSRLREHARRISDGDFSPIGPLRGSNEIRQLAEDIDTMRARLRDHITELDRLVAERTADVERSSRHFKAVFDSSPSGILRTDEHGHILAANQAIANMLGYPPEKITSMTLKDITYPSDWNADKQSLQQTVNGNGDTLEREKRYIHADGNIRWGRVARSAVQHPDGRIDFIISMISDVSERIAHEEALARSERAYHSLFSAMSSGFSLNDIIYDANGRAIDYRFLEINPAFEVQTGLKHDDVVGRCATEVLPTLDPFWIETFGQIAMTGEAQTFEHYSGALGKHYFVTAYCPQKGRCAVIFSDISRTKNAEDEQRRLEQQVQHAQKLESLGVLAGGIAHDFNNLLMGILGNADLASSQVSKDAPIQKELHEIEHAAFRAADLCKQMLAYSGRSQFTVEALNVNDVIREMREMLKMSIDKKTELIVELDDHVPYIEADVTQIRQILMNLIINASEAMDGEAGTVTVRTGHKQCDKTFLRNTYLNDELPEGIYAFVEVTDTGSGIEPTILNRVFEPFFTTKFAGRGLGMSAVLGIIRGHSGAININSEIGEGSTFTVLLPALDHKPDKSELITVAPVTTPGMGSVLVADDEDIVRRVASVMLERAGYQVTTVANGEEVLEKLNTSTFDCILLDLSMPVMGGEETLRHIRNKGVTLPVLMSSGYSKQEFKKLINQDWVDGFVQKPYRSDELLAVMQQVLHSDTEQDQTSSSKKPDGTHHENRSQ